MPALPPRRRCIAVGIARLGFALMLAAIAVAGHAGPMGPVHDDGKAFGESLKPNVAVQSRTAPDADRVPGFTPAPPQASYYSDPSSLAPAAAAAAPSSTGYQAVTTSMGSRATFAKVDLDAVVAPGKAVAADPTSYVSGFGATGTPGNCHPLPGGSASPGTYEQRCNAGYTAGPPVDHSCAIPVVPQFATDYKYECSELNAAFNGTDDCAIYPIGGICTYAGTRPGRCLVYFGPPSYGCAEPGEPITELSCSAPVPGGSLLGGGMTYTGSVNDVSACAAWSGDASCLAAADICTDSTPVTRMVGGVSVTQPCWAFSRTYSCTPPLAAASDCGQLDTLGCTFEREECITGEMPCLTVDRIYRCPLPPAANGATQICDGDVFCLDGKCDTIDRTPNTEFKDAAVALNAMSQAGKEFDPANLTLFKGNRMTCSKVIFGITNCCVPRGFPLLGSCNADDRALKVQVEKGLCATIGTYCTSKVLGICLAKKEAHCCFLSKISRILQEQGRPQIGKPWGDPKTEKCLGFTIDEFSHLDLSRMDFSEVYAEFTDAAKLPDELATATTMQTKITDYFSAHHP